MNQIAYVMKQRMVRYIGELIQLQVSGVDEHKTLNVFQCNSILVSQ